MLYLLTKFTRTPPYMYHVSKKNPNLLQKHDWNTLPKNNWWKTSDGLNFFFHNLFFEYSISFWKCQNFLDWSRKQLFTSEFHLMNHVQKNLAFLKSEFDFQNIHWEFRSFGHDWFQTRHLPKSPWAIFLFH